MVFWSFAPCWLTGEWATSGLRLSDRFPLTGMQPVHGQTSGRRVQPRLHRNQFLSSAPSCWTATAAHARRDLRRMAPARGFLNPRWFPCDSRPEGTTEILIDMCVCGVAPAFGPAFECGGRATCQRAAREQPRQTTKPVLPWVGADGLFSPCEERSLAPQLPSYGFGCAKPDGKCEREL